MVNNVVLNLAWCAVLIELWYRASFKAFKDHSSN